MCEIAIAEWNVRGENSKHCQTYVAYRLMDLEYKKKDGSIIKGADIIVLTEYVEKKNYDGPFEKIMKESGYHLFRCSTTNRGNCILIAIRKNLVENGIDRRKRIYKMPPSTISNPEFMCVYFELDIEGKKYPISIIGYRAVTDSNWENRYKMLENLFQYLANKLERKFLQNIVWVGDFNNGKIEEENNIDYQYKKKNSTKYNYQKIKKLFLSYGFDVSCTTPSEPEVFSFKNAKGKFKLDHLFVKGLTCKEIKYNWDWKQKDNRKDKYEENGKVKGYDPDHAILQALVEVIQ